VWAAGGDLKEAGAHQTNRPHAPEAPQTQQHAPTQFNTHANSQVLMATNRPDTLDPALLRPGRLDRKVEFGLPDLEGRTQIFQIHTRAMACERDIRFELLGRLCPNSTGADIRSVCTEAVRALGYWVCVCGGRGCLAVGGGEESTFEQPNPTLTHANNQPNRFKRVRVQGMFAIRARRKTVTEKDFLDAVSKVIKGYQKFSATPKYMVYN